MDLGLWTPVIWYSTDEADTTDQYIEPYESAECLTRWIKALKEDRPMVVDDIETIKDTFPQEYELYRRLFVDSILAVPIRPRPFGFLLVRNPRRYINRPNLLQLLGVVILQQINTMAVDDGRSMTFSPEDIQDDKDILIHLFGDLTIYT
ncbi:MAG: transcriptional regulator, partial [Clostridia bacterium]|nr:transcriptional regulator [Clostridia bacterium]